MLLSHTVVIVLLSSLVIPGDRRTNVGRRLHARVRTSVGDWRAPPSVRRSLNEARRHHIRQSMHGRVPAGGRWLFSLSIGTDDPPACVRAQPRIASVLTSVVQHAHRRWIDSASVY